MCLARFVKDKDILVMPEEEQVFLKYEAKNHDRLVERMKALKVLRTGKPAIVIVPVSAALKRISPHKAFEENVIKLNVGDEIELSDLKAALVAMGYEYEITVEANSAEYKYDGTEKSVSGFKTLTFEVDGNTYVVFFQG